MELSLDLSLDFVPKTIPEILLELSSISDSFTKQSKLDDYVKRLEDEMRKIDAFKRELPLCVLLLQDAILRLKEEVLQFQSLKDQPVIEKFIPSKGSSEEADGEGEKREKKRWLSSTQLWNTNTNFDDDIPNPKSNMNLNGDEDDRSVPQTPIEHWDCAKRRRAFELFKDQNNFVKGATKDVAFSEVPKLTLMTPISDPFSANLTLKNGTARGSSASVSGLSSPAAQITGHAKLSQHQQTIRKQRRCWSPELHRRFVDALHRLGGSQVATPKQIRELMQVDGLTNDEVKSHLQKYRLHVRKLGPTEGSGGGGWMAEAHQGDHHSKTSATHAGSPDGPLQGGGSGKALSITEGESMEGEEDAKSEGHSWKGRIQKVGD
ncbi:transcription factor HHO5-like [Cucurbita maxima]|uniref:Transcription factor HHO5-like n=1 Tax=Cucurbita maxima TaxID=3661 RepID=A0A6J1KS63_CUCMA|nr:transcription factor HHO5-like [Cucurbita maxima]